VKVSGYVYGTGRDAIAEGRYGPDDLLLIVKRHVAGDHVVQQATERPDGRRLGVVVAVF